MLPSFSERLDSAPEESNGVKGCRESESTRAGPEKLIITCLLGKSKQYWPRDRYSFYVAGQYGGYCTVSPSKLLVPSEQG